ncbi:hypothetical protein BBP40_012496 [Aspergillus hancockii]|nr:hypothetical protein BBP40_012496 [Aspergillus hancockii]
MPQFLSHLKSLGFVGVQNFPTVGLIDGKFRQNLEETGMGYDREVEMIRLAHEMDLVTTPYAFTVEEGEKMARAGADVIVVHVGLTTSGTIGAQTALSLDDCVSIVQEIRDAVVRVNPEVIVLCHGGPLAGPSDAEYVLQRTRGVHGFYGASSMERLPVERAIQENAEAFKRMEPNPPISSLPTPQSTNFTSSYPPPYLQNTRKMFRPLEGKFGIVTGGSRGIGEAIARNLASKGCSLLLNYTSPSSQTRTEELCTSLAAEHSIKCVPIRADLLAAEEATTTILSAAKEHFTSPVTDTLKIDILINNAGVSADRFLNDSAKGPMDREYFNWHYTINVLAPLLLTQACAPYLPTDRSGRIVNISSVSSSIGFTGQSVYGGTKAALEAMTRTWARELADRATVNAVNPGPVIGDMYFATGEEFWKQMQGFQDSTPLSKVLEGDEKMGELTEEQRFLIREKMGGRRPAFTSEVAGVVGMLCTGDGLWCTGSVVCANGGMRMGQ